MIRVELNKKQFYYISYLLPTCKYMKTLLPKINFLRCIRAAQFPHLNLIDTAWAVYKQETNKNKN